MKVVGNATVLIVALSAMVGLLFAQRDFQNSWHEPTAIQTSTTAIASASPLDRSGVYKVVIK